MISMIYPLPRFFLAAPLVIQRVYNEKFIKHNKTSLICKHVKHINNLRTCQFLKHFLKQKGLINEDDF